MPNPLKQFLQRIGEHSPLVLAHHPTCEYYDHHTVEVYDQKLCMGCFIVYPVGFISLVTLLVTWLIWPSTLLFSLDTSQLQLIGGTLAVPLLAGKLAPRARSQRFRIVAKGLLAVGLAVLIFPALVRPSDRLVTLTLVFAFLVPYVLYKGFTARDDCEGCPEADDFPNCSGMQFHESDTEDELQ